MERKEIKETLEELRDEFDAQPAWAAHESSIVYLSDLYERTKEAMKEFDISTADLKKAAEAAMEAEGTSDFATFKNIAENSPVLVREMNRLFLFSEA